MPFQLLEATHSWPLLPWWVESLHHITQPCFQHHICLRLSFSASPLIRTSATIVGPSQQSRIISPPQGHLISKHKCICILNSPLPCNLHLHRFQNIDIFGGWYSAYHTEPTMPLRTLSSSHVLKPGILMLETYFFLSRCPWRR